MGSECDTMAISRWKSLFYAHPVDFRFPESSNFPHRLRGLAVLLANHEGLDVSGRCEGATYHAVFRNDCSPLDG